MHHSSFCIRHMICYTMTVFQQFTVLFLFRKKYCRNNYIFAKLHMIYLQYLSLMTIICQYKKFINPSMKNTWFQSNILEKSQLKLHTVSSHNPLKQIVMQHVHVCLPSQCFSCCLPLPLCLSLDVFTGRGLQFHSHLPDCLTTCSSFTINCSCTI